MLIGKHWNECYDTSEAQLDKGITYDINNSDAIVSKTLVGWIDSAYADDVDDSHSISGYIFLLNGGLISWHSTKEKTVVTSTCQAEYMAQCSAAIEVVWLRSLLEELGFRYQEPITLYADNQGAIALVKDPKYHKKTKHIAVRYHYTRELVQDGLINLHWLPTDEMKADGLTKALPPTKFSRFINLIGFWVGGSYEGGILSYFTCILYEDDDIFTLYRGYGLNLTSILEGMTSGRPIRGQRRIDLPAKTENQKFLLLFHMLKLFRIGGSVGRP